MMWLAQWNQRFREEPTPETIKAMEAMCALCGPYADDPMIYIAMYLQYQLQIFDTRAGNLVSKTNELKNMSEDLGRGMTWMKNNAGAVSGVVSNTSAAISTMQASVSILSENIDVIFETMRTAEADLARARYEFQAGQSAWRLDLKLVNVVAHLTAIIVIGLLAFQIVHTKPVEAPSAAQQASSS